MAVLVSVVVPTYRRPDLLERCLRALVSQDFDPSGYEIIVVDDATDEETRRLIEFWSEKYQAYPMFTSLGSRTPEFVPWSNLLTAKQETHVAESFIQLTRVPILRYLANPENRGPAAARNLGWQEAAGEIIAFTDDDCIPEADWLKKGVGRFAEGVSGVGGRVIVPITFSPTDFERETTGLERSEFVTANCFYRRDVLQSTGGFDERFVLPWREDSDLYFRLLKLGCPLVEAPEAVVVHPVRPAPWGISLSQQRKSMYNALIYKKHPCLYREKLQPNPPWHYYGSVLALLTALFASLKAIQGLELVAASIWVGLTLRFAAARLRGTSHSLRHTLEMLFTSILIPPLCVFWRLCGALKYRVLFL